MAGSVALQPGEVAAGVDVEKVGLRRVPNVHGDIVMAAQKQQEHRLDKLAAEELEKKCREGESNEIII